MKIPQKYKAVCFDMDNTLLKTELDYKALGMSVSNTIKRLGVNPAEVTAGGIDAMRQISKILEKRGRKITVDEIIGMVSDDMCAVEMSTADKTVSFPGTVELLESLRNQGFGLGILSNGFSRYVNYNIDNFSLRKYFETIVSNDDLPFGQQKPEPAAMIELAKRMNVKPEEILYIGDSIGDYLSATGAGAGFVAVCTGNISEEQWKMTDGNITVIPCVTNLLD